MSSSLSPPLPFKPDGIREKGVLNYIGELSSVDGYMNIALEKTVEYVNGEVRNKYGDVFIRGNNGAGSFFFFFFSLCGIELADLGG